MYSVSGSKINPCLNSSFLSPIPSVFCSSLLFQELKNVYAKSQVSEGGEATSLIFTEGG